MGFNRPPIPHSLRDRDPQPDLASSCRRVTPTTAHLPVRLRELADLPLVLMHPSYGTRADRGDGEASNGSSLRPNSGTSRSFVLRAVRQERHGALTYCRLPVATVSPIARSRRLPATSPVGSTKAGVITRLGANCRFLGRAAISCACPLPACARFARLTGRRGLNDRHTVTARKRGAPAYMRPKGSARPVDYRRRRRSHRHRLCLQGFSPQAAGSIKTRT